MYNIFFLYNNNHFMYLTILHLNARKRKIINPVCFCYQFKASDAEITQVEIAYGWSSALNCVGRHFKSYKLQPVFRGDQRKWDLKWWLDWAHCKLIWYKQRTGFGPKFVANLRKKEHIFFYKWNKGKTARNKRDLARGNFH